MKTDSNLTGKWILITGASSGMGHELAIQLATKCNVNLILAARREDRLQELKTLLTSKHTIEIDIIPTDLFETENTRSLIETCLAKPNFHGAILNAGLTYVGPHTKITEEKENQLLQLNLMSTSQLLKAFVTHFEQTGNEGRIMVVSSLGANFALPYQALYSATKAFLTNLTTAISLEIENPDLKISTFSPGGVKTELSEMKELKSLQKHNMELEPAMRVAVNCFLDGRYNVTPGLTSRFQVFMSRFVPKKMVSKIIGKKFKDSFNSSK
ncbi:MAG: SDR family NAD(P)-dependent oxidoreductase [Crocinitomicaceae bacterium]|nr:SDR family NAD(P)-dependent oxidoreductase [Crocinitomicaceae bacterium]